VQDNGAMVANPAALVYGTIAVAALLAAESAQRETYAGTVTAVVVTLLLYWFAHSYAQFTGRRLQQSERFTVDGLAQTMRHELPVLIGATVPLAVLLAWWAAGARLTAAVSAAVWTSAGTILVIEVMVGLRLKLTGRDLVAQTALGALLGLLVVALRVLLH
jgi:hypothetical protein